jgi:hypothetical protein
MGALKKETVVLKPKTSSAPDNVIQKAEIERMKQLVSEKIKNPELARKAAMIISEMLDKK